MDQRQLFVGLLVLCASACGGGGGNGKGASSGGDESGESGESGGGEGSGEGENGGETKVLVKAPKVGTKALERRFVSLDFELTLTKDKAAGGMQAGSWSIEEERSYEVLGANDSAITKLSLAYGRREAKSLLGVEETAATAAHSYVLEAKGGEVSITPTKSKDLKAEEKEAVNGEYDWVGQPSPLLAWLDNGEIASGKKREGGAAETRALLGAVPSSNATSGKVTVTSKGKAKGDRPALALDVEATVQIVSGETVFDLSLKGPAKIDLETGWVADLDLAGSAKASGRLKHKKGMLNVSGTAKAVLKRSMSF